MQEILPATPELLERYYGEKPRRSQKAVVAVKDGEVIGVAGVYTEAARYVLFSDMKPECLEDKRFVIKGIKAVMGLIRAHLRVDALADPEIDGADRLLRHMRFEPIQDGVYRWRG